MFSSCSFHSYLCNVFTAASEEPAGKTPKPASRKRICMYLTLGLFTLTLFALTSLALYSIFNKRWIWWDRFTDYLIVPNLYLLEAAVHYRLLFLIPHCNDTAASVTYKLLLKSLRAGPQSSACLHHPPQSSAFKKYLFFFLFFTKTWRNDFMLSLPAYSQFVSFSLETHGKEKLATKSYV